MPATSFFVRFGPYVSYKSIKPFFPSKTVINILPTLFRFMSEISMCENTPVRMSPSCVRDPSNCDPSVSLEAIESSCQQQTGKRRI